MKGDVMEALKPEYVVPLVAYLTHESSKENGSLFEVGAGFISKYRWQRSEGYTFDLPFTPEDVRDKWSVVIDFNRKNENPSNSQEDTFPKLLANYERNKANLAKKSNSTSTSTGGSQSSSSQSSSALKSQKVFDLMKAFFEKGEGKDNVGKVQAVFNFDISAKKGEPAAKSWVIDLKNAPGKVYEGKADNADATFSMVDEDFESICLGKLNPQNAFLQGKMKIKGNMRKATLFTPDLFPPPTEENIKKYLGGSGSGSSSSGSKPTTTTQSASSSSGSGLRSQQTFDLIRVFLDRGEGKPLVPKVAAVFNFEITPKKGEPIAKTWTIDLKNGQGRVDEARSESADATFTMTDEDFENICLGKLNPQQAFLQGKMKIKGNMKKATLFTPELFPAPTAENLAKYQKAKL